MGALLGCAGAAVPTRSARLPRYDETRATEALERASVRAARCLGVEDRVTVEGWFEGESGRFQVERSGAASRGTTEATRQCVATWLETARVGAFRGARRATRWTVAGSALSAAVRAMMAERAVPRDESLMGTLDWRAAITVVLSERREMRLCYETALRGDPSAAGRVVLRLVLSVDGRITEADFDAPAVLRDVGHCILGRLRTLEYPQPRGAPVELVLPMAFRPEG